MIRRNLYFCQQPDFAKTFSKFAFPEKMPHLTDIEEPGVMEAWKARHCNT